MLHANNYPPGILKGKGGCTSFRFNLPCKASMKDGPGFYYATEKDISFMLPKLSHMQASKGHNQPSFQSM